MKLRQLLSTKLHRGTVTECDINYEGSCGLGPDLIAASGVLPYEKISVLNISTGHRLETYVIPAGKNGEISLNGAAARYATPGDKVILLTFTVVPENELAGHRARIIVLDDDNQVVSSREVGVDDQ
jgi:aspartate 1-decarboxylase